jgi:hypothetical protein
MIRSIARACAVLAVVSTPLAAQVGEAPRSWHEATRLSASIGGMFYQGSGSFFEMVSEELTLSARDFRAPSLAVEAVHPIGDRLRLIGGMEYTRSSLNSASVGAVPGTSQKTVLWTVGGSAGAQLRLRGGAAPADARSWDPYASLSAGAQEYRLVQRGAFADYRDASDVFNHTYRSRGVGAFGQVGLGAARAVTDGSGITVEVQYRFAQSPMTGDFSDFDALNLSGFRASVGVTYPVNLFGN